MPLVNATSVAAVLLLLYLSSFILLAIIRVATGISIQRIGYFSLRHIAYTPKEGLRIDLRGLGLSIHRPTFAQPTWISVVFEELKVTVDPAALEHSPRHHEKHSKSNGGADGAKGTAEPQKRTGKQSQLWKRLTKIKEQIKTLHRQINLLRMFDVIALNTSAEIVGVGYVQIASFTAGVYTRRKLLDRGRLFRHKKDPLGDQKPAEWVFVVRSILLGVGGRDPVEILDAMSINVHGLLYKDREGLRDTSIAIKVGRLYVPVDEIMYFSNKSKKLRQPHEQHEALSPIEEVSFEDLAEEFQSPGSREAAIVQTVAESKEFLRSTLQSVQEVQLAMSFIRISKEVEALRQANLPLFANVVVHEIGIDLHRLEQDSPAHRMYFQKQDIAHQALFAAVSISVSLDEDDMRPNRIMYVPMATATIRTTLPGKTMSFTHDRDVAERNTNILFGNLVVTSPSLDLTPQHLMRLHVLSQTRQPPSQNDPHRRHRLISRLLPKASIKFSIHEPVVRFVVPVANNVKADPGDFDMIISSVSSISLDVESSHSLGGDLLYSLNSSFRVLSHKLYYQASCGDKHNLIINEALELKCQISASTEVAVTLQGNLRTFSVLMVRDEVSKAVYNIVKHFKTQHHPNKMVVTPKKPRTAFLRKIPAWLVEATFEGSGCSFEAAGQDVSVSSQTRGFALELESWSAHYTSIKSDASKKAKNRKTSTSVRYDEHFSPDKTSSPPPVVVRHHTVDPTDGRRLACHVKGFDGFVIESAEAWEPAPFLSVPRLEVAFSTSRDQQGPTFHTNAAIHAFYLDFSLYKYYSMGVGSFVIKEAFLGPVPIGVKSDPSPSPAQPAHDNTPVPLGAELFAIDVKARYIQVKAQMPHDPSCLLQVYQVSAGKHRWSAPFLRAELARLHVEAPHLKRVWARIVSISGLRVDLRHSKKKTLHGTVEEKSIDVATEFIRLGVPHGIEMYKMFDNIVNVNKAMKQLHHRFKTRSNEYVLGKHPEPAKKVPRISVRTKALCFELEDDPFEWKLGIIYHIGLIEQKQRLARQDAFNLKVKRMNDEKRPRSSSRYRTRSAHSSRHGSPSSIHRRSHSVDATPRRRSQSRGRRGKESKRMRYDRDGVCALTSNAKIEVDEAAKRLSEHNSRSWKRRIDYMLKLQSNTVRSVRKMFTGADEPPHDENETETILGIPDRPGLMTLIISDLHLIVDKPSFPEADLPKFMHEIGKGMPLDMQYGLLIPTSLALDMGEARIFVRDYPINLLHIPAIRSGQSARLPSWSFRSDFVIAEEFRDEKSIKHNKIEIVPKGQHGPDGKEIPSFAIDVRRTIAPTKMYSKPVIDINTSLPTTISWGTAYQPVIQDIMMVVESFTKPDVDPSERVGFWDKIRLNLHSRWVINWKGDGDLQLRLKGTRNPYVVTGYGAGFVMCWRNNVQWLIHQSEDAREFMTIKSGEFVWAIPDYSHEARNSTEQRAARLDSDSSSSSSANRNAALFKKVIMKLSGAVQWNIGLVFERDLPDGSRTSNFRPHYDVVLRNPLFLHDVDLSKYDAYHDFRSNHLHLSIGISAPSDRDWSAGDTSPSESYNSVHLSPRFFSHFFNWWSTFSGVMSLPIRQGALWKPPGKASKKFGRHLSTIKYNLLLSPLFISHVYKHKDAEDYQSDVVSATGLKIKIDSFMFDLHQRREYFNTLAKGRGKQMRTSGMKINKTELDFVKADLRAVAALIAGTTAEDLQKASDEMLASLGEVPANLDLSQFTIPDQDLSWIDMDDFVELDWVLPAESNPETKILPLAFTPRFTYFRETDHGEGIQGDPSRTSPFGKEDTHFCVMGHENDPRKVQINLIENRLQDLDGRLHTHVRIMNEHELLVVREGDHNQTIKDKHELLIAQQRELESKQRFLQHGLARLKNHANPGDAHVDNSPKTNGEAMTTSSESESQPSSAPQMDMDGLYSAPHDEFASDFNNRFIIHNVQLKWNNALRNILLRYSHQVSQRRGFVYYMSRRAVKFILDIVDEQAKSKVARKRKEKKAQQPVPATPSVISPSEEKDEDAVIEERIKQLLGDATRFVEAPDPAEETDSPGSPTAPDPNLEKRQSALDAGEKIADNFQAMNSYHLRLIAPQIQLQSEKNPKAIVLISAKGMQLKVVSIMDKERMSDDVSGLVQRRYALDMDGAQFFVATQKTLAKYLHLYSGNRYGNAPGLSWPPWVCLEAMFDFHLEPFGFQRVIQKTSASLRYEKYNPLRLKYNEEVESNENGQEDEATRREHRIDQLWVDFPRIRARCDSTQYYSMYIIVLDLLMYSEPLEKTRSERLEKIMLASDFSDLRGAPEMAEQLQERIRQLDDIKLHFQINSKYLDKQGWQDRINLEKDLASCEDELFFIMKAINNSQQRSEDRKAASETSGLLRWYLSGSEVVWHLMRDKNEPLLEFQLGNAAYERIDNTDGSNHNALEIEHIRGWNLLNNALYPEIIGPYHEPPDHKERRPSAPQLDKMVQVHWYMLEAIAGIPVLEHFQVTVFPLKVQLERELGKKLFEYIFPGQGSNAFDSDNFSPLMVKNMEASDVEDDQELIDAHSALMSEQDANKTSHARKRESSPGVVAKRLKPTYGLNYDEKHVQTPSKNNGLGIQNEHHRFFKQFHNSNPRSVLKEPTRKGSSSSLRSAKKANASSTSLVALGSNEEKKRAKLHRATSKERGLNSGSGSSKKDKKDKATPNDDLSQMLSRASNYMTLAHVKLNSFVVCLSYKGKSDRNFEDLHDFVFRMPVLEYRNKTWSNLDLALRLKKDVIRALISHTGAIIGNKFSHHRPSKKQVERLKEIAHSSTIPNSDINLQLSGTSETTSLYSFSQDGKDDDFESSGISFQSPPGTNGHHKNGTFHGPSPLLRSGSWSSNVGTPNLGNGNTLQPRSMPGTAGNGGIFGSNSSLFSQRRPSTAQPTSAPSTKSDMPPPPLPHPPATSHGPKSLLKGSIGRHFGGGDTVRKGVSFGGLSLIKSESHKDKDHHGRDRSESQSSALFKSNTAKESSPDPFTTPDSFPEASIPPVGASMPAPTSAMASALQTSGTTHSDSDGETKSVRRQSVLLLGKKVLNRLS
jgi:hypothetical protein